MDNKDPKWANVFINLAKSLHSYLGTIYLLHVALSQHKKNEEDNKRHIYELRRLYTTIKN